MYYTLFTNILRPNKKNKCVLGYRSENLLGVGKHFFYKKKKILEKNMILCILKGIIKLYFFPRKPKNSQGFTSKIR